MTQGRYAAQTYVPTDRTRAQIEKVLGKYGATDFGYLSKETHAAVLFRMQGRAVRMILPLPKPEDLKTTPKGRKRSKGALEKELAQALRQRWRALLLSVTARCEAVHLGITSFDQEWLPFIVTGDGQTFAEKLLPHMGRMLTGEEQPDRLLGMA